MATFNRSLDFGAAFGALRALLANPDDTKQAFRVIQALGGPTAERLYARFRSTEVVAAVLRDHRALLTTLKDQAKLEAMPETSLGRAYLDFLRSQKITADGLVAASEEGDLYARDLDPARRLFSDRLRDMHDLWHVVSGYRGDLIGETSVLALSSVQTRNPGVALIAFLGFLKEGELTGARTIIAHAFVRGHRAAWLPGVDWEAMLPRPLGEVRAALRLEDTPTYEPVYTSDPRYIEARTNQEACATA